MTLQETEPDLPCECLKICYGGMGGQLPATGIGTLEPATLEGCVGISPFWRPPVALLHSLSTPGPGCLRPNNREGAQPHPSDIWIQDTLSIALPTRARPNFPHSQSLPSGSKNYNPAASRKKQQHFVNQLSFHEKISFKIDFTYQINEIYTIDTESRPILNNELFSNRRGHKQRNRFPTYFCINNYLDKLLLVSPRGRIPSPQAKSMVVMVSPSFL